MARPAKQGLDYFPLDIDFFTDTKFVRLRVKFGAISELLALRIFSEVYKNGYYVEYSENLQFALAESLRIDIDEIDAIVSEMAKCGLFDAEMFNSYKVLTSCRIQKTWLSVAERRKEKDTSKYWLLAEEKNEETVNVDNNEVNVCNNSTSSDVSARNNEQSKDKDKDKVNDMNRNDLLLTDASVAVPQIKSNSDAIKFFIRKFGNKNILPLNLLLADFGSDAVADAIDRTPQNASSPVKYIERILEDDADRQNELDRINAEGFC